VITERTCLQTARASA